MTKLEREIELRIADELERASDLPEEAIVQLILQLVGMLSLSGIIKVRESLGI
jgi:hypothetical protein